MPIHLSIESPCIEIKRNGGELGAEEIIQRYDTGLRLWYYDTGRTSQYIQTRHDTYTWTSTFTHIQTTVGLKHLHQPSLTSTMF